MPSSCSGSSSVFGNTVNAARHQGHKASGRVRKRNNRRHRPASDRLKQIVVQVLSHRPIHSFAKALPDKAMRRRRASNVGATRNNDKGRLLTQHSIRVICPTHECNNKEVRLGHSNRHVDRIGKHAGLRAMARLGNSLTGRCRGRLHHCALRPSLLGAPELGR